MSSEISQATLDVLHNPDGSATHTSHGYTIIASINGPIEVSRRDELPEESTLEVHIRPATGVGTPQYRSLEQTLHATLRRLILITAYPRSLIQLTLQILRTPPVSFEVPFANSSLPMLPSLLTTSLLVLLASAIPLRSTLATVLTVTDEEGSRVIRDTIGSLKNAKGLHVFGSTGKSKCALALSEGDFMHEEWEEAYDVSEKAAKEEERIKGEMDVDGEENGGTRDWLLEAVNRKGDKIMFVR